MYDLRQQVNSLPKRSLGRWQHWSRQQFPKTPGNIWCKSLTNSHKGVRALPRTALWSLWHGLSSLPTQGTEFPAFSIKTIHVINKSCFLWDTMDHANHISIQFTQAMTNMPSPFSIIPVTYPCNFVKGFLSVFLFEFCLTCLSLSILWNSWDFIIYSFFLRKIPKTS